MPYRSADEVLEAAGGTGTRRVLILTALSREMAAVLPHVTHIGSTRIFDGTVCECGLFSDEGEELLVVVAETGQGNLRANAVAVTAPGPNFVS